MSAGSGIMLAIPTLQRGGAELVMSRLAGWLHCCGHKVSLLTFEKSSTEWPVRTGVRRVFINDHLRCHQPDEETLTAVLRQIFDREHPAVILSFLTRMNLRTLKAAPAGTRVIVCERSYPPARGFPPSLMREIVALYPSARALVVQTERCKREWASHFMPRQKTYVLPNPYFQRGANAGVSGVRTVPASPYIVAIGRLTPEKGFLTLLEAFAVLRKCISNLSLLIAGDGPQRQTLINMACALGVEGALLLPGFCEDIRPALENALCFVLPSHYEGFPNALLEAMWHGTPCVAANCAAGPEELLGESRGVLFPPGDSAALAQILLQLCRDAHRRAQLGSAAAQYARAFTEENVFSQWSILLRQFLEDKQN